MGDSVKTLANVEINYIQVFLTLDLPQVSGVLDSLRTILAVKAEVKKPFSVSAFTVSFVMRAPAPFLSRPTFSLVVLLLLWYL